MHDLSEVTRSDQYRALGLSTFSFTVCFAVWTIFSIIGVKIKQDLGLSETEFGILVATPVLTGSRQPHIPRRVDGAVRRPSRIRHPDADHGSRLLAPVFGSDLRSVFSRRSRRRLAGGSFIVGVAYTSQWFEKENQGTALGIFGAGNVGAAITNFFAPFLVLAFGWEQTAQIYSVLLALNAVGFYLLAKPDPGQVARRRSGRKPVSAAEQLAPLRNMQVWRFATYYFFVFGGFVALASYLPRFYVGAYDLPLATAGMLAAAYSCPVRFSGRSEAGCRTNGARAS